MVILGACPWRHGMKGKPGSITQQPKLTYVCSRWERDVEAHTPKSQDIFYQNVTKNEIKLFSTSSLLWNHTFPRLNRVCYVLFRPRIQKLSGLVPVRWCFVVDQSHACAHHRPRMSQCSSLRVSKSGEAWASYLFGTYNVLYRQFLGSTTAVYAIYMYLAGLFFRESGLANNFASA